MPAQYPGQIPNYTGQIGGPNDPLSNPSHVLHHQNIADDVTAIATVLDHTIGQVTNLAGAPRIYHYTGEGPVPQGGKDGDILINWTGLALP